MVESGSPCEREKSECRETGGVTFREALVHRPPPGAGRRPGLHAPLGPGGSGLPTPGSQTSGPRNWEKPHSCGQEDMRCAEGARLPGGPALGAHPSLLQAADSRPPPIRVHTEGGGVASTPPPRRPGDPSWPRRCPLPVSTGSKAHLPRSHQPPSVQSARLQDTKAGRALP